MLPKNVAEERDLWRVREDWAVDRKHPGGLWYDVSVPIDRLAQYLADFESRLLRHDPALQHLCRRDTSPTATCTLPSTRRRRSQRATTRLRPSIYAGLREIGGSFSAEHGIGLEKRTSLEHWAGDTRMRLMHSVKALFDPEGVMNPGKVLSAARQSARARLDDDAAASRGTPAPAVVAPAREMAVRMPWRICASGSADIRAPRHRRG